VPENIPQDLKLDEKNAREIARPRRRRICAPLTIYGAPGRVQKPISDWNDNSKPNELIATS
jgi:hypothetical protein